MRSVLHSRILYTFIISVAICCCKAVNASQVPDELWQRVLSFVDMKHSNSAIIQTLDRRTFRFYDPDFVAIHNLESIIYKLESINDTADYHDIWSLSKQIQLSSIGIIAKRFDKLCQFVCDRLLSKQRVFYENRNARKLMHALGFKSIGIHEYIFLNLNDDEQIRKLHLTKSGIKKLKLLLLASRGSVDYLTAVLNDSKGISVSQQSADIQEHAYNQIAGTHNFNGDPLWIWFNFPWLAAPDFTYFPAHSFLLYFGALYEFLWKRYHHEFGFPKYHSMFYISDFDDKDLVQKMEFVKYLMDRYRFKVHEKFSETKRETLRWMDQYTPPAAGTSMWLNVKTAQRSLFWTLAEAVRLNKLLMPRDEVLANQFMTAYVLEIAGTTGGGILAINLHPKQIFFVETLIKQLIEFNGPDDPKTDKRLRGILRVIKSVGMG